MGCHHHHLSPKARFYKSFRSFIVTLSFFFLAGMFIDNGFFDLFRVVGTWWGIFLAIRYIKINGMPGTKGWLSDDWFDWIQDRHQHEDEAPRRRRRERKIPIDGKDYDPLWKDKDMV